MLRRLLLLLLSAVVALSGAASLDLGAAGAASPHEQHRVADRDCGDFNTQAAAQRFFLDHGGPRRDPHRLDSDGDGIACESNPCPCSNDTTPGGDPPTDPPPGEQTLRQKARVIRVIDGDTVKVRLKGGPRRTVRVLGIDTPEVYGGVECGGRPASRSGRQLLPRGTVVTLTSDTTQDRVDRYDRLLRYIANRRGFDFGRAQLRRGWARVYVYQGNPFKRTASYKRTQADAKRADRGIWGAC